MNIIDVYAKMHNTTRYRISKVTGIAQTSLSDAGKKPIENMTIKTLISIAKGADEDVGITVKELIEISNNPLVIFVNKHNNLNKKLIKEIERLLSIIISKGIKLENISFKKYYDDNVDTDSKAEEILDIIVTKFDQLFNEDDIYKFDRETMNKKAEKIFEDSFGELIEINNLKSQNAFIANQMIVESKNTLENETDNILTPDFSFDFEKQQKEAAYNPFFDISSPDSYFQKYIKEYKKHDYKKAMENLTLGMKKGEINPDFEFEMKYKLKNIALSEEGIQDLVLNEPENIVVLLRQANVASKDGEYLDAVSILNKARDEGLNEEKYRKIKQLFNGRI